MTRTIDFDAFRSEQKAEPLELILGGVAYELPGSLPAALALDIARMQATKGPDAEFSEADVERLGSALFGGSERFHEILMAGAITIDELPELTKQILFMYGGGGPDSGNRAARRARAKTTRSRSSRTGDSSKQTS